jgi:hypothetical protein
MCACVCVCICVCVCVCFLALRYLARRQSEIDECTITLSISLHTSLTFVCFRAENMMPAAVMKNLPGLGFKLFYIRLHLLKMDFQYVKGQLKKM